VTHYRAGLHVPALSETTHNLNKHKIKMLSRTLLTFLVATATIHTAQSSSSFFVDWNESECVRHCDVSDTSCIGRPKNHWDLTYGSLAECCAKALWWKVDCSYQPATAMPATPRPSIQPTIALRPNHPQQAVASLTPTDDTYIQEADPIKHYGGKGILKVTPSNGNSHESLLRFDVSSIQKKCIDSATLSLYSLLDSKSGGTITAYDTTTFARDDDWNEHTLTWLYVKSIEPMTKGALVLDVVGKVPRGEWVHFNVTGGLVGAMEKFVTFRIVAAKSRAKYASKESKHPPRLSVVLC
jgi:hypothetical protein